jgi:predicted AAA+ superfamily ATPase
VLEARPQRRAAGSHALDPAILGPLVETLAQSVIRGNGLQVHFFREFESPGNRRSRSHEVDFVVERLDGAVLPIEIKFRKKIDAADSASLRHFMGRHGAELGILVTRETSAWDASSRILQIPLQNFLLAF